MISFIRIDDRMIHGQTCTRWSLEYPCTGLIAVNDKAASTPVLKAAYKNASDKKTFVWTMADWQAKKEKVLASQDQYFLIAKNPVDMAHVLLDQPFDPGIKTIIVGPCNDRPGAVKLGNNQSITQEEARANGEEVDDETINGIRAGLMGPLAGIGDSLVVGTLLPILLGIALGLSGGGSPLGAIFYILVWNIGMFLIMRFMYFKGYELGGKAVEILVGEKANAIRDSIIMLGTMVIGGVTASWINIQTSFQMLNSEGGVIVDLQKTLNDVYPSILSAVFVLICWYLLSKKRMSPVVVMLILVAVAFVGVLLGFFDPGLSY